MEVDSNSTVDHPTIKYATMISGVSSEEPTLADKIKAYVIVFFLGKNKHLCMSQSEKMVDRS